MLIVGSGITGAMTAFHAARSGLDVVVVDRRAIASGSTTGSTALLLYELDTPLLKLAEFHGMAFAEAAYRSSNQALLDFVPLVRALDDACDLAPRSSLYLAREPCDINTLAAEARARAAIGLSSSLLSRAELRRDYAIDRPAAILSRHALEVNPLRLTHALLREACRLGARLYAHTPVHFGDCTLPAAHRAGTGNGRTIRCRWIVVATGYEAPDQFALVSRLTTLSTTFALATTPFRADPWPGRPLLWEHAEPYLYARTTPDNRILAGGEDIGSTSVRLREAMLPLKARRLMRKLRALGLREEVHPACAWAGVFAHTADGLPLIGEHPRWPRVLFALGYGGNGITFSLIAAQVLTSRMLGAPTSTARLFALDRSTR